MDLLIVERLEPEIVRWLEQRHSVAVSPELAADPLAFRRALHDARATIVPSTVAIDAEALRVAPLLCAVGTIGAGLENIDLDACARSRVEVVRSPSASAHAEAEFMLGALLSLLRRVPIVGNDGALIGRELSGSTVGLIGMAPAARVMTRLLAGFEARVIGYDPSLHRSDGLWQRWGVAPVGLRDLLERSDAVCVQLAYFNRYRGLLGSRLLSACKQHQVLVSISHSALFDDAALADALDSGRLAAAWLDSLEPGALDEGRPLSNVQTLQITPRLASATQQSRERSAWAVVRRIDELLEAGARARESFTTTASGARLGLAGVRESR